jgi:hypothetical protein
MHAIFVPETQQNGYAAIFPVRVLKMSVGQCPSVAPQHLFSAWLRIYAAVALTRIV